jgi:hypothetical protein
MGSSVSEELAASMFREEYWAFYTFKLKEDDFTKMLARN